jgi:hypothetical protein
VASHNPKVDLAKRQAVGVYRPVARFATKAQGDFRPVEGHKAPYNQGKPAPVAIPEGLVVKRFKAVAPRPERKRAGSVVGCNLGNAELCDVKHRKLRDRHPPCALSTYKPGASVLIARATR